MWVELHDGLRDHPKLVRLARDLGIPKAQAVGHLTLLWTWTMGHATDGDLGSYDAEDIELAAEWEGEPGALVAGLIARRWLDRGEHGLMVHDWLEYAGSLKAAQRQAARRAKKRGNGGPSSDNHGGVTRQSRDSHATEAEQSGDGSATVTSRARAQTGPDRTGPDRTGPDPLRGRTRARALDHEHEPEQHPDTEPEPPWPRPGNDRLTTAAGDLTPGEVEACLCDALAVTQLPGGWVAETLADLGAETCDAARLRRAVEQAQAELGKPPPTPRAAERTLSTRLGYVRQRLLLPREQRRAGPRNVHAEPQDYAPPPAEIWGEGAA